MSESISFSDQSSYTPTSWSWQFPGSNTPSSTQQNPANITYSSPGVYQVTLIAANSFGNDTLVKTCYINVQNETGISNIGNEIPSKFSLEQNYPNPFNPITELNFQLPKPGFTRLVISDITGKTISILVDEDLNSGTYNVDWDASAYSSGVYFYTLTSGDFKETRKMLLIK